MKRLIIYTLLILFVAVGCNPHRIQNRHRKHSRKFTKRINKKRSQQYKRLRKRPSINSRGRHKKMYIKNSGGNYIVR